MGKTLFGNNLSNEDLSDEFRLTESPVRQFEYDSKVCLVLDFTGTEKTEQYRTQYREYQLFTLAVRFFLESNEVKRGTMERWEFGKV